MINSEIGFHRFSIELIEEYSCKNQFELNQRQGFYIRQYVSLNHNILGRPQSEYIKTLNTKSKQHKKEYNNGSVICKCRCKIHNGNLLKHQNVYP